MEKNQSDITQSILMPEKCFACGKKLTGMNVEKNNDPVFTNDTRISFPLCLTCADEVEAWYNALPESRRRELETEALRHEGAANS